MMRIKFNFNARCLPQLGSVPAAYAVVVGGQWRNYERRSEAIASGRQAAEGARGRFGRRIVCFALQNSVEFLKRERS